MYLNAIRQYSQVGVQTSLEGADPHRLIQMLMDAVVTRVATAKGNISRQELASKSEPLANATAILAELRRSLDFKQGGEIAANLDALYEYMERRLLEANLKNDPEILEEVIGLMKEIKSAWDAIPEEARRAHAASAAG